MKMNKKCVGTHDHLAHRGFWSDFEGRQRECLAMAMINPSSDSQLELTYLTRLSQGWEWPATAAAGRTFVGRREIPKLDSYRPRSSWGKGECHCIVTCAQFYLSGCANLSQRCIFRTRITQPYREIRCSAYV